MVYTVDMGRHSVEYKTYIHSPEWRALCKRVRERDHNRCRHCRSKKYLQVHHLTYDRLGHERMSDLLTLCRKCHRAADVERRRRNKRGSWLRRLLWGY